MHPQYGHCCGNAQAVFPTNGVSARLPQWTDSVFHVCMSAGCVFPPEPTLLGSCTCAVYRLLAQAPGHGYATG